MSTARFHTPERQPTGSDMELYDKVFAGFGVSTSQFSHLMAQGARYRAAPGGIVVQGGVRFQKVAMIVSGEAIAYRCTPGLPDGSYGPAVCKYVGKLSPAEVDVSGDSNGGEEQLATRGSVIGGSALADKQITDGHYPADVIASTHIDWVEWDLNELESLIDAPRWRSVQACFYYMLYVDLLSTLDRERAAKMQQKEAHKEEAVISPSTKQLLQLSAFVAVPFCGFGFADNFIMIVAGDTIDAHFGAALGLTTLAAAGLGNWMSDVVGLGLGDAIERAALKLGISDGKLTPAQTKSAAAKLTTLISKIVGITVGCFLGMMPLLFLTPTKKEFAKEDLALYDAVFGPNGVPTDRFADLMERGTKKWANTGATMVQGGMPYDKVTLLVRGEVAAYAHNKQGTPDKERRPLCVYVGRLGNEGGSALADRKLPSRGSIIGGTVFADPSKKGTAYPNDLVASKNIEWVEWDREALLSFMKEETAIQASFYSLLYSELIQTLSKDSSSKELEKYQLLLRAVIQDGRVDPRERDFVLAQKEELRISDEEHCKLLVDLGWTKEDWERGSTGAGATLFSRSWNTRRPANPAESVAHLQRAMELIEGVVQNMESASED